MFEDGPDALWLRLFRDDFGITFIEEQRAVQILELRSAKTRTFG